MPPKRRPSRDPSSNRAPKRQSPTSDRRSARSPSVPSMHACPSSSVPSVQNPSSFPVPSVHASSSFPVPSVHVQLSQSPSFNGYGNSITERPWSSVASRGNQRPIYRGVTSRPHVVQRHQRPIPVHYPIPATPAKHPFMDHYSPRSDVPSDFHNLPPRRSGQFPAKNPEERTAWDCDTIGDITNFRHATLLQHGPQSAPPQLSKAAGSMPTTLLKPNNSVSYSVATFKNHRAILQACHVDTYAPDRGDLRMVSLGCLSVNSQDPDNSYEPIEHLRIGDIIFVESLLPTLVSQRIGLAKTVATDPNDCTSSEFRHLWNVGLYSLAERHTLKDSIGIIVGQQTHQEDSKITEFFLTVEGHSDLLAISPRALVNADALALAVDKFYEVDLFVPSPFVLRVSEPFASEQSRQFIKSQLSAVRRLPSYTRPNILNMRPMTEVDIAAFAVTPKNVEGPLTRFETAALCRIFAVAVTGINALERAEADLSSYDVSLRSSTYNGYSVAATFSIQQPAGKVSQNAWPNGAYVRLDPRPEGSPVVAKVLRTFTRPNNNLEVCITASVKGKKALQDLIGTGEASCSVRQLPPNGNSTPTERLFNESSESLASNLCDNNAFGTMEALYGRVSIDQPEFRDDPIAVQYDGRDLELREEQRHIVHAVTTSRIPCSVVSSSFGCGKTFLALIMAALNNYLHREVRGLLSAVVANNNETIVSAVNTASKLGTNNKGLLRVISERNWRAQTHKTAFDLPKLMREVLQRHIGKLSEPEQKIVRKYLDSVDRVDDDDLAAPEEELAEDVRGIAVCDQNNSPQVRTLIQIFWAFYRPKILLMTVSTFLLMFGPKGALEEFRPAVNLLEVDEASQLPESSFAALLGVVPQSRVVVIGDDRQLQPFQPTMSCKVLNMLANRSLLSIALESGRVPVYELNCVFRCHPSITRVLSDAFYGKRLVAVPAAEDRMALLNAVNMPNAASPWALLNVDGRQKPTPTGSWSNEEEAEAVYQAVDVLLRKGFSPADLSTIAPYKAQRDLLESKLHHLGVSSFTIDAIQGREFKVVLVSVTRTTSSRNETEFFDDSRRINVALSRATDGVLIFSNGTVMKNTVNWSKIYSALWELQTVASAADFLKFQTFE